MFNFPLYLVGFILVFSACSSPNKKPTADFREPSSAIDRRGSLDEYDPGPDKNSKWPDIFAETPNYRAYGKAIYQSAANQESIKDDGQEKFRWKVGPMWYRGRLAPNSVKVFVIGQEGAQDENVSNRTFTGSTGTKMQNFINYFGIDRSYLFMNTFIYTITGQYGEQPKDGETNQQKIKEAEVRSQALFWLAQNEDSIIVQHRHKMFDYMLETNKDTLKLIIGVGAAGKDSLITWLKHHNVECTSSMLSKSYCRADNIAPGVKAIAVPHPGAASARNGGSDAANNLKNIFPKKAKIVADLIRNDPNWLTPDLGMKQNFEKPLMYKDAPIPYRDFAFGTNLRMGNDGTASNRRGADGIQIYSKDGCYNNVIKVNGKCDRSEKPKLLMLSYQEPKDIPMEIPMLVGDVPWESPKSKDERRNYDQGPREFSKVLLGLDVGGWPDFSGLGITQHTSFGLNGLYRGNLENPEVVILADQESNDDIFSGRALTGTGGQKLQKFLNNLEIRNYLILRTLPVDSLDLSSDKVLEISLDPKVMNVRRLVLDKILEKKKTKLIIAIGAVAQEVLKKYGQKEVNEVFLNFPDTSNKFVSNWNSQIKTVAEVLNLQSQKEYDGSLAPIPRGDLPVHTRWWMGTSGTRSSRAYLDGKQSGDYYKFDAPMWVNEKKYPAKITELYTATPVDAYNYLHSIEVFNKFDLLNNKNVISTDDKGLTDKDDALDPQGELKE